MAIVILALLVSGTTALVSKPFDLKAEVGVEDGLDFKAFNEEFQLIPLDLKVEVGVEEGLEQFQDDGPFDKAWPRDKVYHAKEEKSSWKKLVERRAEQIKGLQKLKIIFYGDSLVEHWSGEGSGRAEKQYASHPQIWKEMVVDRYGTSHASGIGGDRIGNLLWRLQNGEKPAENAQPKVIMLQIGTNDLRKCYSVDEGRMVISSDKCSQKTFAGYQKVVEELKSAAPDAKILLTAIMPRHPDWGKKGATFGKVVEKTNKLIEGLAADANIGYVDCGHVLLKSNGQIDPSLARDFLHPTLDGAKAWAECLQQPLDEILLEHPSLLEILSKK